MNKKVNYYTTFKDENGHEHYAVHSYDRISGIVLMMRDILFPNVIAPIVNAKDIFEDSTEIVPPERYYVEKLHDTFNVVDRQHDRVVATFYTKEEADEYAEVRNGDEKWLDDIEDPWL